MIYLLSVSISNHNHQLYLVVVVGHDIVVIITLMHVICFSFFHFYDDDVEIFFRPSNRKNPSFIFRQQKKKRENQLVVVVVRFILLSVWTAISNIRVSQSFRMGHRTWLLSVHPYTRDTNTVLYKSRGGGMDGMCRVYSSFWLVQLVGPYSPPPPLHYVLLMGPVCCLRA